MTNSMKDPSLRKQVYVNKLLAHISPRTRVEVEKHRMRFNPYAVFDYDCDRARAPVDSSSRLDSRESDRPLRIR